MGYNLVIDVCVEFPSSEKHQWYRWVRSLPFAPYTGLNLRIGELEFELSNLRYDTDSGVFVEEVCDSSAYEEYREGIHFYEAFKPLERQYLGAGFELVEYE